MKRSKCWILIVCLGYAFIPLSTAWGGDFERGRMLYETRCLGCHESTDHIESKRTVGSLRELRHQIVRWSVETESNWRKNEIDDVLEFLNKRHYRFEDEHI